MDLISTLARLIEREDWPDVLGNLHNLAKSQGRTDLLPGLRAASDAADAVARPGNPREHEHDHDDDDE